MKEQYSMYNVLRHEEIFGKGFVSVGGLRRTQELFSLLQLQSKQNVLDIGCGTGGACFYAAKKYGVHILGVDCSEAMIELARKRRNNNPMVTFELVDIHEKKLPEESFDVIYSKDVFVHIFDKRKLFEKIVSWLRPGGNLLFSDYCIGEGGLSLNMKAYSTRRQYHMIPFSDYKKLLEYTGFSNVFVMDSTREFIEELQVELNKLESRKEAYIRKFSEKGYTETTTGWKKAIERSCFGEQRWGTFLAVKS